MTEANDTTFAPIPVEQAKGHHRKVRDAALLLTLCGALLLGATPTHAEFWGWSTTISARDETTNPPRYRHPRVSGATYPDCDAERANTVVQLENNGYVIEHDGWPCGPVSISLDVDIPDLRFPLPRWPWPGPVCLTCPYLFDENIKVLFPNDVQQVRALIKKYDIDAYNRELLELQKGYKLQAFEGELFAIERKIPIQR